MRIDVTKLAALTALALGLTGTAASVAEAQFTVPRVARIPEVQQRSGLSTRYQPRPVTNLPTDPHRDNFYGTRYGDYPVVGTSNCFKNGGLYGQMLPHKCTQTIAPYFQGSPGGNATCPKCRPASSNGLVRLVQGFTQPFRPVGGYYQNGAYVPLYDLDPLVPGPGPDLWPHFIQIKDDAAFFGH